MMTADFLFLPKAAHLFIIHYDDSRFSILAQGRSPFHLSALEATFIKTSNPALCQQKEFVYSFKIVH